MSKDQAYSNSLDDLKSAIASGELSGNLEDQAGELLRRLEKPVRLSVLGPPESGKSTLSNLLLGQDVIPAGLGLSTTQISFGDEASTVVTLPDGTRKTLEGAQLQQSVDLGAIFIDLNLPLPALRKISILELVASDHIEDQKRALTWAAGRTDIALWCTQDFTAVEQDLWSAMPEALTDHAFLLITKADILGEKGQLGHRVDALGKLAGDQFKTVLPIATTQANAARKPDGSVDREMLRASGGIALIGAILKDVETGRQAAIDQVDIFLRQINFAGQPETGEPHQVDAPAAKIEAAPQPVEMPSETPQEAPKAEAEPNRVLTTKGKAICTEALERLMEAGQAMRDADAEGETTPEAMMTQSSDTLLWLSDHLSENASPKDPLLSATSDAAIDAADLIQLVQIEEEENGPADALTLMVQLKEEIEAALAA